jgi:hypothetical protein
MLTAVMIGEGEGRDVQSRIKGECEEDKSTLSHAHKLNQRDFYCSLFYFYLICFVPFFFFLLLNHKRRRRSRRRRRRR